MLRLDERKTLCVILLAMALLAPIVSHLVGVTGKAALTVNLLAVLTGALGALLLFIIAISES